MNAAKRMLASQLVKMNSTQSNSACKKVTKAAATPLPPSPPLQSKKPQSLTIEVTSSVTLDFDAWRGFSHTKATDYNEVEEYETALKAEWDMLLDETNGKLEWDDDDGGPEDDMIELILEDYDYCAPDPPPKMTEREKEIVAKYEAKMAELEKKLNILNAAKISIKHDSVGCWDHYVNGVYSHSTSGPKSDLPPDSQPSKDDEFSALQQQVSELVKTLPTLQHKINETRDDLDNWVSSCTWTTDCGSVLHPNVPKGVVGFKECAHNIKERRGLK